MARIIERVDPNQRSLMSTSMGNKASFFPNKKNNKINFEIQKSQEFQTLSFFQANQNESWKINTRSVEPLVNEAKHSQRHFRHNSLNNTSITVKQQSAQTASQTQNKFITKNLQSIRESKKKKKTSVDATSLLPQLCQQIFENSQEKQQRGLQYTNKDRFDTQDTENEQLEQLRREAQSIVETHWQVKPDNAFRAGKSLLSSKVIELWIRDTLMVAEIRNQPSMTLAQSKKDGLMFKFGIDRHSMMNEGLSSENCDAIYRALFVYSVGFHDSLKQHTLANSSKSDGLVLTINLWKTYEILLESACKTDYQMLVTHLDRERQKQLAELRETHDEHMATQTREKGTMQKNLSTMQLQLDKIEKERNNERSLRLRLEEEYMTMQRNHEEEVKLRLKFEQKLNTLNTDFRNLNILHNRTVMQLGTTTQALETLQEVSTAQKDELVERRKKEVVLEQDLSQLREYKKQIQVQVASQLKLLEQESRNRRFEKDQNIELQFTVKQLENQLRQLDVECKDLKRHRNNLQAELTASLNLMPQLMNQNKTQEQHIMTQDESLQRLKLKTQEVEQEVTLKDREQGQTLEIMEMLKLELNNYQDFKSEMRKEVIAERTRADQYEAQYKQLLADHQQLNLDITQVNAERHEYVLKWQALKQEIQTLEEKIIEKQTTIDEYVETVSSQQLLINGLKERIDRIEDAHQLTLEAKQVEIAKLETNLASQLKRLTGANLQLTKLETEVLKLKAQIGSQKQQIDELNQVIREQLVKSGQTQKELDKKKAELRHMDGARGKLFDQLQECRHRLEIFDQSSRHLALKNDAKHKQLQARIIALEAEMRQVKEHCSMRIEDYTALSLQWKKHKEWADSVRTEFRIASDRNRYFEYMHKTFVAIKIQNNSLLSELQETCLCLWQEEQDFESIIYAVVKRENDKFTELQELYTTTKANLSQQIETMKEQLKESKMKNVQLQQDIKTLQKGGKVAPAAAATGKKERFHYKDQEVSGFEDSALAAVERNQETGKPGKKKRVQPVYEQVTVIDVFKNPSKSIPTRQGKSKDVQKASIIQNQVSKQVLKKVQTVSNAIYESAISKFDEPPATSQLQQHSEQSASGDITISSHEEQPPSEHQTEVQVQIQESEQVSSSSSLDIQEVEENMTQEEIEEQTQKKISYQRIKYEEYREYLLESLTECVEEVNEEVAESQEQTLELLAATVKSVFHLCIEERKQNKLPKKFRNLILTESQLDQIQTDIRLSLTQLRIDNLLPSSSESDEPTPSEESALRKYTSQMVKAHFQNFMEQHNLLLRQMVLENQQRLSKLALSRKTTSYNLVQFADLKHVLGKHKWQMLMQVDRMSSAEYEIHKNKYLQALKDAAHKHLSRVDQDESTKMQVQNSVEQVRKGLEMQTQVLIKLMASHRQNKNQNQAQPVKTPPAPIQEEVPADLQPIELQMQQKQASPVKSNTSSWDDLRQLHSMLEPIEEDTAKAVPTPRQLLQIQEEQMAIQIDANTTMTGSKKLRTKSFESRRRQSVFNVHLERAVQGGVARVNSKVGHNSPLPAKKSSLRTMLRAAHSRV